MSERRQRSTRYLSRETVQLMLQMKSLLRQYGVTISLTAPDVHDLLIQAAEAIDDEEVDLLRLRLIAATQPASELSANPKTSDEKDPFIDEEEKRPAENPVFTNPSAVPNASNPLAQNNSFAISKSTPASVRNVYIQETFIEEVDVFLEGEVEQVPTTKRVALNTPRTGLLRCDHCQRTNTVMAAASQEEAIEIQCACGMVYRVILDSRKFDRKPANLPGFYVDQNDDTKTGTIVVENISFGGLRFRTTSPQNVTYDDLLYIQFTLDDDSQTLIWEKVRVHYVNNDVVGAEFMDLDKFNKSLASYLMR
ncbi:MAG: hypothetical protein ETSY2_50785 [Candidatus Entotheonella gemina]|uniref:PilZ domain-containing protein n=1 Tax=Candidatus Entotheonella gemina TaxID=1429439 RepID=W4L6X3_9BACT|nr:MAG: hypothetical protein ETSY2_50785 [Candidatus Entotheonella gemina]